MHPEDIPEIVLRFIERHIDTVPQLEALLLLWEDSSRAWTEQEVSQRIYVSHDAVAAILSALVARRLINVEHTDPPRYRFNSEWENAGQVREVAGVYRRRIVHVANFIHSRGSHSVREFARAFDLKKER